MTALARPARTLLLALLVAAAMATQFVVPASAAQLTVNHSGISTFSASACTDQVIAITAPQSSSAQTQLEVEGVPAECAGTAGTAVVLDAAGNVLVQTTWTTTVGTNVVSTSEFNTALVEKVVLLANGWWINTLWTAPVPTDPTPPVGPLVCYKLDANGNVVTDAQGSGVLCDNQPTFTVGAWGDDVWSPAHLKVEYSLNSTRSRSMLVFDFSDPAYGAFAGDPARASVTMGGYDGSIALAPSGSCADRPVVRTTITTPAYGKSAGYVEIATPAQSGQVCAPR